MNCISKKVPEPPGASQIYQESMKLAIGICKLLSVFEYAFKNRSIY